MLARYGQLLSPQAIRVSRTSQGQCRAYTTPIRASTGDDLGPTRKDAYQTFRVRKDAKERYLPLPPVLDPATLEGRSKWENTKAQPKPANFTEFQKKLQANPFAHALASPVRQCRMTLITLPNALLTTLHARPHPTTAEPWLLPVSLTTDKKQLGPPYHFIGRHTVTIHLSKKGLWQRQIYMRMVEKHGSGNLKKAIWREDLPDLITDLMRKQLVKTLSWSFSFKGRLTPVASPRTEDLEDVEDVSCVLIYRSLRTPANDVHDRCKDIMTEMDKWSNYVAKTYADKLDPHASPDVTHTSPNWYYEPLVPRLQPRLHFPELEFHSTTWRGRKIALYSLTDLLGADEAQRLVRESQYASERCVVMKNARHNAPIQILLMRLQAYIAQPGT
ncbi:hypothetical protein DE146DRAFT_616439 [Phaeosphaeria sp. MPI-PUGE-AT-0046c]|nr:hypothetical protein DE146DRAFT_616439 [Phaeosphaeria sp. MPI-PUGE-AT-0046c]